ncbi:nucleolar essential protein-like protein [Thalictrum thalictroides]|uniref:Nucleolar essential protein-like protein n=1 Tax=Thalictrum thalictroides TaxID=46969 RepID=A0A7J6W1J0_THATH|nr:nucleolar essential protein-like protein [Thalictrum thalictroides]
MKLGLFALSPYGPQEAIDELPGIPIVPSSSQKSKAGVIFVLEKASLEVAKVGKAYQLLNSDDHSSFLLRHNRNPGDYRPDITHQVGNVSLLVDVNPCRRPHRK